MDGLWMDKSDFWVPPIWGNQPPKIKAHFAWSQSIGELVDHLDLRLKLSLSLKTGTLCPNRNVPSGHWYMAVCQNLVLLVNIKIAGKWMFIPLKMVLIGIDPYPYTKIETPRSSKFSRGKNYGNQCFWAQISSKESPFFVENPHGENPKNHRLGKSHSSLH